MTEKTLNLLANVDSRRDAYGFAVRPQHLQRYREYADIYKEEEEERSDKWNDFLDQHAESTQTCSYKEEHSSAFDAEATEHKAEAVLDKGDEEDDSSGKKSPCAGSTEGDPGDVLVPKETKPKKSKTWVLIRPSLGIIENMMSSRIKKVTNMKDEHTSHNHLPSIREARSLGGEHDEDHEEEYFDEAVEDGANASSQASTTGDDEAVEDSANASRQASATGDDEVSPEPSFPWKELEFLVHGGVPRAVRGEVWQAFVGVNTRRVERYYQDLLAPETNEGSGTQLDDSIADHSSINPNADPVGIPEKWRKQIEKDLPRTFPGHPALDGDGRNSLRRLLLAYARHNPSVGYCQAMNFFAGLLLLMMPEENAFWTLVGIIDDYFDGYYSEEMIESQVDQLVFEELMRERFPKLVNHLDYLGVEVAWLSGPWFLSIYVNLLPWESVLRVWDVLLFEGNRVMLFRTALALMDLYGPALVTTKDAGDAVTLLQSLAGSTFDSSQLVLTACMGFLAVTETRLQELREKHRPAVLAAAEERKKGGRVWKDSKGLASKLYSFKHDPGSVIIETNAKEGLDHMLTDGDMPALEAHSTDLDKFLSGLTVGSEVESVPDLQEQVVWLKVELCRLLEEKRSATMRAEELETALMEMVKQDNRRQLSARVEQLEQEVAELRQALADKREQEAAMLQMTCT
ncbi:uncharacterized protein LOC131168653 isoform X2 [Malania oleifera]|uniref:uncharacterized protein LOC131168653 isoform X2 n=1 Tax=Malania oleifera TaxID=397392 RepID=UPI0025AE2F65|nr:uncharacterized protein LOC131168653 isoform X2 [Malania oleifera]